MNNARMKDSSASLFPVRLPKQIQRALPIYVAFTLVVVFFWTVGSVSSFELAVVWERVRLYQSHSEVITVFPRKIWQTWKIDALEFEERDLTRARSWTSMNPGYRYEVLTDGNDLHYVETNCGPAGLNRPDIVYYYKSLTGGVYADIDVEALQPVDKFIPPHFDKADVDLVISVEIDEPTYANHTILGPKSQSFCQWTLMSKPRNPAILRIINNIIDWLTEVARSQNVHVSEIKLNFDDVLSGTGPSAFTTAVLAEMKVQTGRRTIEWNTFHNMSEPKLIGRILVLTVEAFAAGQGHSNSGDHSSPKALVKHHYHASKWPDRHPRYSHPGYGMVEECNWESKCVAAWDNHTAVYPSLSEEEKSEVLAAKKKIDEARFNKEEQERVTRDKESADRKETELREKCAKLSTPPTDTNSQSTAPTEAQTQHEGEHLVGLTASSGENTPEGGHLPGLAPSPQAEKSEGERLLDSSQAEKPQGEQHLDSPHVAPLDGGRVQNLQLDCGMKNSE